MVCLNIHSVENFPSKSPMRLLEKLFPVEFRGAKKECKCILYIAHSPCMINSLTFSADSRTACWNFRWVLLRHWWELTHRRLDSCPTEKSPINYWPVFASNWNAFEKLSQCQAPWGNGWGPCCNYISFTLFLCRVLFLTHLQVHFLERLPNKTAASKLQPQSRLPLSTQLTLVPSLLFFLSKALCLNKNFTFYPVLEIEHLNNCTQQLPGP